VASKEKSQLSFEQALEKLETLVDRMEAGDVGLSELLEKYEEGTRHLQTCEARLKQAELKIEKLRATREGADFEEFASGQA